MATIAKRAATYADLEAVPPHLVAEILFGTLVTHPRPVPRHGAAGTSLSDELVGPFQKGRGGPGGWIFIAEPELHLGPHVAVPDLGGWRRERLPKVAVEKAYIEVAPDWVCEVLSPSTEKYDRGDKRTIYATYGVEFLWLLDPRAKLLETFKRTDRTWTLTGTFSGVDDVGAPPFAELTFPLGRLWPFDDPTTDTTS
jgi:Uma2 family endonuclease